MERKCWFCKNTEDYFIQQKEELLQSIEKELIECDTFEKNIIDTTKEKFGFTDDIKNKVRTIKAEYASMTLNAVLENKESFIKLDSNLETVINYYYKFGNKKAKNINDVIQDFLLEPTEQRYKRELSNNESKKKSLLERKSELEKIKTFFVEKEITPASIDNEISKLDDNNSKKEQTYFGQETQTTFSFSYQALGFNFSRKVLLCPICLSLFAEAANTAFEVTDAQNSWDD
ncbi:MAG: hypothetical protein IJ688_14950 [Treponema sp.]|uniref:hypothetical protein n=1 Tax=Treponema sp. TaxID=166 RepID=UPI0025F15C3F|nr:hypothetical protein [Treponema sp.]MBQ8678911.1 hypothetical protein [Treponema sp.]MBR1640671.1 hypothetical protein [Treponema sp.]